MLNFIVVQVDQDYDYVQGVDYIDSFATEDEAKNYIKTKQELAKETGLKRINYIDEYVNKIEVPDTDYHGWVEFLKEFPFWSYVYPKDFKKQLKCYLYQNHTVKLEEYDPPEKEWSEAHAASVNLFIVEIK